MEAEDKKIILECILKAKDSIKFIDWHNQEITDSLFLNLDLRIKKIESSDIFCRDERIRVEFWEEVAMMMDLKIDVLKMCVRGMQKQIDMLKGLN